MENVINHWDQMGVLQKCMEHKLVYLETKDVVETTLALDNYKKACDSGRGAVFLSIARGKVAEGIDFDNHYGRCVVLFGIPYQYTKSHVLRARLDFMREKYQVGCNPCHASVDISSYRNRPWSLPLKLSCFVLLLTTQRSSSPHF